MIKSFDKILFLDIETVPIYKSYNEAPLEFQKLWDKKSKYIVKDNQTSEEVYSRAGIYAEFGKIICIAFGMISEKKNKRLARISAYYGDDEKKILQDFADLINRINKSNGFYLCAHNGKEFDFPYICRRMLINGIKLPEVLKISGSKPWENPFLDTLELWKFGDYKHYTSLELLTYLFGIPSPKNDIDGSMVYGVYWNEKDIERIVKYCKNDVIAVMQLYLRMNEEEIIADNDIEII